MPCWAAADLAPRKRASGISRVVFIWHDCPIFMGLLAFGNVLRFWQAEMRADVKATSRESSAPRLSSSCWDAMLRRDDVLEDHTGFENVTLSQKSILSPVCGVEPESDL